MMGGLEKNERKKNPNSIWVIDDLRVDDSAIPFAHVLRSALLIRGFHFNLEVIELRSGDGPHQEACTGTIWDERQPSRRD